MAKAKKTHKAETKKGGPKAAGKNKTKPEKKPKAYFGMAGVSGKKQKAAVDTLIALIRELIQPAPATAITLVGGAGETLDAAGKKRTTWTIACIETFTPRPGGGGSGRLVTNADAPAVVYWAEQVLATHGRKPVLNKKTKEVQFDDAADAVERFKHFWTLPDEERARNLLAYLLWAEARTPDATLAAVLAARPQGFYGDTVRTQVEAMVAAAPLPRLHEGWEKAAAVVPNRFYELRLRGWEDHGIGEPQIGNNPLVKYVSALPAGLSRWLGDNPDLRAALAEPPVDLAKQHEDAGDQAAADHVLRTESFDNDLLISGTGEDEPLAFMAQPQLANVDPAAEWAALAAPEAAFVPAEPGTTA